MTKKYGNFKALENVDLKIPSNQISCIVGMNGSGKTTLLRVLTGQNTISQGAVYYRKSGSDFILNSASFITKAQKLAPVGRLSIGYCAQDNNLPPTLKISEIIDLFAALKHSSSLSKVESILYIESLLDQLQLTSHLNARYQSLSVGAKRRVALLVALVNKPDLILLDEPVTGLDDESSREFWNILNRLKGSHTMVVITHNITSAQDTADYCGILHRGRLLRFSTLEALKEETRGYIILRARSDPHQPILLDPDHEQRALTLAANSYFT